jgi:hypothetical protein
MPTFVVAGAQQKKTLEPKDGKPARQIIGLLLKDGQGEAKVAEWFTNATTPIPGEGSTLEGELSFNQQYGRYDFKRAQQGFGGLRPEDPVRAARILRQHSQTAAIQFATLMHSLGRLPEDFGRDQLKQLVDWFDLDVNENGGRVK